MISRFRTTLTAWGFAIVVASLMFIGCGDDDVTKPGPGPGGDGPTGWFWQSPLPQGNTLLDVCVIDANTAAAVGEAGTILRTTDGGASWETQISGTTSRLMGVSFADANTGTVVGYNGTILRTVNGGATWERQVSPTGESLVDVCFANADTGIAVEYDGGILRTTDGGAIWVYQGDWTDPAQDELTAVHLADANTATAVGEGGTIPRRPWPAMPA